MEEFTKSFWTGDDMLIEWYPYGFLKSTKIFIAREHICLKYTLKLKQQCVVIKLGDIKSIEFQRRNLVLVTMKDVQYKVDKLKVENLNSVINLIECLKHGMDKRILKVPPFKQKFGESTKTFSALLNYRKSYTKLVIHLNNSSLVICKYGYEGDKIHKGLEPSKIIPLKHLKKVVLGPRPFHVLLTEKKYQILVLVYDYLGLLVHLKNICEHTIKYELHKKTKWADVGKVNDILKQEKKFKKIASINNVLAISTKRTQKLEHQTLTRPRRKKTVKRKTKTTTTLERNKIEREIFVLPLKTKKLKKPNASYIKVYPIPFSAPEKEIETLFNAFGKVEEYIKHRDEGKDVSSYYFKYTHQEHSVNTIANLKYYSLHSQLLDIQQLDVKNEIDIFKNYESPFSRKDNITYKARFKNNHDGSLGVIRYLGYLQKLNRQAWVGIQFDGVGKGDNDGTIFGKRYFLGSPRSSSFIKLELFKTHYTILTPGKKSETWDANVDDVQNGKKEVIWNHFDEDEKTVKKSPITVSPRRKKKNSIIFGEGNKKKEKKNEKKGIKEVNDKPRKKKRSIFFASQSESIDMDDIVGIKERRKKLRELLPKEDEQNMEESLKAASPKKDQNNNPKERRSRGRAMKSERKGSTFAGLFLKKKKKSIEKPVEKPIEKPIEKPAMKTVKPPPRVLVKPVEKPVEKSPMKIVKPPPRVPAKPVKKPVKKPPVKIIKPPARVPPKPVKNPIEKPAMKIVKPPTRIAPKPVKSKDKKKGVQKPKQEKTIKTVVVSKEKRNILADKPMKGAELGQETITRAKRKKKKKRKKKAKISQL